MAAPRAKRVRRAASVGGDIELPPHANIPPTLDSAMEIFPFPVLCCLTTMEAAKLRRCSSLCRDTVARYRWEDTGTEVKSRLHAWRACFPHARGLRLWWSIKLTEEELPCLRGLRTVIAADCKAFNDAALAQLEGSIHTLDISAYGGRRPAVTDAGFVHLQGIHTLSMSGCNQITDAGLVHLKGIHTLDITLPYHAGTTETFCRPLSTAQSAETPHCGVCGQHGQARVGFRSRSFFPACFASVTRTSCRHQVKTCK